MREKKSNFDSQKECLWQDPDTGTLVAHKYCILYSSGLISKFAIVLNTYIYNPPYDVQVPWGFPQKTVPIVLEVLIARDDS